MYFLKILILFSYIIFIKCDCPNGTFSNIAKDMCYFVSNDMKPFILGELRERLWYNLNMQGTIFKNFISPRPDRVSINPKMGFVEQIAYFRMHQGIKQNDLKIFCEK